MKGDSILKHNKFRHIVTSQNMNHQTTYLKLKIRHIEASNIQTNGEISEHETKTLTIRRKGD